MGEGFESDKIILSTNIWHYMQSHSCGYNWGASAADIGSRKPHNMDNWKSRAGPQSQKMDKDTVILTF